MVELIVIVAALLAIVLVSLRFKQLETRIDALESLARLAVAYDSALRQAPPPLPGDAVEPARTADPSWPPPVPAEAEAPLPPPFVPPVLPPTLPPPPAAAGGGFEEALGTRWAVWVGGVALALGGVFLVRYSIEQDLVGPRTRVAFGFLLAIALMVAGEWLRRRESGRPLLPFGDANVPAVLTAAGTSTAFATSYAAYGLYGLIGPTLAFVLLGLVSFVAMATAILHGPALAGLGLAAALASPLLVETANPNPLALVLYLVFATGSAYAVARLRLWRPLAVAAATGAILWGWAFVLGPGWVDAGGVHLLLQLALAIVFLVVDPYRGTRDEDGRVDGLVAGVMFAFAVLAVAVTLSFGPGLGRPVLAGVAILLLAGAAFRYAAAAPSLGAAALAALGTLAFWPVLRESSREPLAIVPDLVATPMPAALSAFLLTAFLFGAAILIAGLGRLALGRSLRLAPACWYAGAVVLGPLAILVVAYWRVTFFDRSVPFALVAAALAVAYASGAAFLKRQDPENANGVLRLGTGAMASAAIAALAAGLTFAFDRGVLTVTLALTALGTAIVAERIAVPALRYAVGALGLVVAARLAWDPSVVRGAIGETPIFNWLLWGYGVPALAFGLATRVLARSGRDGVVRFVESLSLVFATLLIFLQIRHALHAGRPFAPGSSHLEAGLVVTEMLAFALLSVRLDLRGPDKLYQVASVIFGLLALVGAAVALGLRYNPLFSSNPVIGGPVFNSLLPAYLIPAFLAAALAWASRLNRPHAFVVAAAALALALELAWWFLEVRRLFHGPRIDIFQRTSNAELWCYTAVLVLHGIALLGVGIWRESRLTRLAAAACLVAAVGKVFVVDVLALDGLARALSFLALGLALVGIGLGYQRLMAARAARPA